MKDGHDLYYVKRKEEAQKSEMEKQKEGRKNKRMVEEKRRNKKRCNRSHPDYY